MHFPVELKLKRNASGGRVWHASRHLARGWCAVPFRRAATIPVSRISLGAQSALEIVIVLCLTLAQMIEACALRWRRRHRALRACAHDVYRIPSNLYTAIIHISLAWMFNHYRSNTTGSYKNLQITQNYNHLCIIIKDGSRRNCSIKILCWFKFRLII